MPLYGKGYAGIIGLGPQRAACTVLDFCKYSITLNQCPILLQVTALAVKGGLCAICNMRIKADP